MDKRYNNEGNPVVKGWEKFFKKLALWKTGGSFNVQTSPKIHVSRAYFVVIPNSTPIITITIKTYILKVGKNEIQGIVGLGHLTSRL